jgi:hypothetical protein
MYLADEAEMWLILLILGPVSPLLLASPGKPPRGCLFILELFSGRLGVNLYPSSNWLYKGRKHRAILTRWPKWRTW